MMKKLLAGLLILTSINVLGALSEPDKAILAPNRNLLTNGGFENGLSKWTFSGGILTSTTTSAAVGFGTTAGVLDATGAGQTIKAGAAIPAGLFGRNGVVSCLFRTPSGSSTYTLAATDTSNILASASIPSSTTFTRKSVNFIFPTSGSAELRITAVASNEPAIDIDDCYLGPADAVNISQMAQATWDGAVTFPAASSCQWRRTSNATFGSFSADSDCTLPAGGNIEGTNVAAPATKIPAIVLTNVSTSRRYVFHARGTFDLGTGAQGCSYKFTDGTVSSNPHLLVYANGGTVIEAGELSGELTFASAGSHTVEIQTTGAYGNTDCGVDDETTTTSSLQISVTSFPLADENFYRPDLVNQYSRSTWSGIANCIFTGTAGVMTDSDCGAPTTKDGLAENPSSSNTLALKVSNLRAGRYKVIASGSFSASYSASTTQCTFDIYDGTNVIGTARVIANASGEVSTVGHIDGLVTYAAQSNVEFLVRATRDSGSGTCDADTRGALSTSIRLEPADQNTPAPLLVGGVVSDSTGVTNIFYAQEDLTSTSSCAQTLSSNSNVTCTRTAAGKFTLVFPGGMFSQTPICSCSAVTNAGTSNDLCEINNESVTPAATTMAFAILENTPDSVKDHKAMVHCMGPK